jgi:hypothetical protein
MGQCATSADAEELPFFGHDFEVVGASVFEGQVRARGEVSNGSAREHLARSCERSDASANEHADATSVVSPTFAFAGVHPGSDVDVPGCERGYKFERAVHRFGRPREGGESQKTAGTATAGGGPQGPTDQTATLPDTREHSTGQYGRVDAAVVAAISSSATQAESASLGGTVGSDAYDRSMQRLPAH